MSQDPLRLAAESLDLSKRFVSSTAVVASPAAAAETIIAQLTVTEPEAVLSGIWLGGWAAFTVGTNGTAVQLRIRRTSVAGTTIAATGAVDAGVAATKLMSVPILGVDTTPTLPNQIYCLTMIVTAGSAASTVSAVALTATVV